MWLTRRHFSLGLAATLTAAGPARGASPPEALPTGLALRGFDPVTYFLGQEDAPVSGRVTFELDWHGRTWRFCSAANRDAFRRDPDVYAPRLGGFDPVGILAGRLVDADPLIFAILPGPGGDRLYLFRNRDNRETVVGLKSLALDAEARWPGLSGLTDADGTP